MDKIGIFKGVLIQILARALYLPANLSISSFLYFLSCQEGSDQCGHHVDRHGDAYTVKGKKSIFMHSELLTECHCYVMSLTFGSRNAG